MIRRICPEDHELRPLAAGEATDGEVSDHVTGCPACRQRVDQMAAAVRALRRDGAAVLTESWPEPGPSSVAPGALSPGASEEWTPPDPTPTPAPGAAPAVPPAIGKYLVVGEVDRGGQAVVYRVVHAGLGRDLALKYARNPLTDGDPARGLIAEEARVLAGIPDHPGLVRVHGSPVTTAPARGKPPPWWPRRRGRSGRRTAAGRSTRTSSRRTSWSTSRAGPG
jgi:hypothetical protein